MGLRATDICRFVIGRSTLPPAKLIHNRPFSVHTGAEIAHHRPKSVSTGWCSSIGAWGVTPGVAIDRIALATGGDHGRDGVGNSSHERKVAARLIITAEFNIQMNRSSVAGFSLEFLGRIRTFRFCCSVGAGGGRALRCCSWRST